MGTAQAVGMQAIGVSWGFGPEAALLHAGAAHVAGSVTELLDRLLS